MKKQILSIVLLLSVCTGQVVLGSEKKVASASLLEKYIPGARMAKKVVYGFVISALVGGAKASKVKECGSMKDELSRHYCIHEKFAEVQSLEESYGNDWCSQIKNADLGVNCFPLGPAAEDRNPCFDDGSCTDEKIEEEIGYLEENIKYYHDHSALLDGMKIGDIPAGADVEMSGIDMGRTRRKFPKKKSGPSSGDKLFKRLKKAEPKSTGKEKTNLSCKR